MACLKALCACILIFLIVSSDAASGEARRLQAEPCAGEEAPCVGTGLPSSPGGARPSRPSGDDDLRRHGRRGPTTPGHSPGIGNKIIAGEARRLLAETTGAGEEASCVGAGCLRPQVAQGRAGLAATTTTKMATTDGRPTAPGHSPGIGNKIAGNTR
ncbi:unnamed protein product [Urochloa decumbens]|uniref:Uncharacterized protein n=1 Tax=Urochloa decumbens TaxID=240449 RepID=A0ABC9G7N2_9POAL